VTGLGAVATAAVLVVNVALGMVIVVLKVSLLH
jgi:hypothetical protein